MRAEKATVMGKLPCMDLRFGSGMSSLLHIEGFILQHAR